MPTYEYECKKCSYNFEVFQSMSDEPVKSCPQCGDEVRRLIFGGAGVIFRGSGFYVTDKAKSTVSKKTDTKGDTDSVASTTDNAAKCADPKGDTGSKGDTDSGKAVTSGGQRKTKPAAKTA